MNVLRIIYRRFPWIFSLSPVLIVWELVGRTGAYPFIPPLSRVLHVAGELIKQGFLEEARATLTLMGAGFFLALTLGLLVGICMARYRPVEWTLDLYISLFMAAPVSALVPVIIVVFGLGPSSIIVTVFVFAFFMIAVNTYTGVREVMPSLVEMARSFGAGEGTLMRKVIIPGALPYILVGIRLGLGRAINGALLGEMLTAVVGVGGLIMFYGASFRMDYLSALVLMVVVFAVVLLELLSWLERRLMPWIHRST